MSVSAVVLIGLAALLCGAALAVLVASHLSSRQKALLYDAQERVGELEKSLSESQSACQVLQTRNEMLLSSREDDRKRYEEALNAQKGQVDAVLALEDHYRQMDNQTLQAETDRFKALLASGKTLGAIPFENSSSMFPDCSWNVPG